MIALSFVLALAFGEAVDCLAQPRRALLTGGGTALIARAALIAWVWCVIFGLTGRPLFTVTATVTLIGLGVAISNAKQRTLQEPLVFSDIALLEHIPGHLALFYVPRQWQVAAVASLALILGWLIVEPRSPADAQIAAALLAAAAVVALLWRGTLFRPAARLIGQPEPQHDVARLGLLVTVLAYLAGWRLAPAPAAIAPMAASTLLAFDTIIVVQAESFVDLRRLGYPNVRLPTFDRLKQTATFSGLLEVPCAGAYTLRPESAVLSGVGFHQQGFDRFHPYVRPRRLAANALPRLLAGAGWDTQFIHPYDRSFFRRHRAMPALGFARFVDERAFRGAKRYGPYVSDESLGDFLLDTLDRRKPGDPPLFAYAVTMEAHDPYGAGRLPDEDDPVRQYVRHIENTDLMLTRLAKHLEASGRRCLLVMFGDHVPFLPAFADPFEDARTDYLVCEFGPNAAPAAIDFEVSRPEHLHALILRRLAQG